MLDIKLKNNNRICLMIALLVTAVFSAGFMALYPSFENKADNYYKDRLSGNPFLEYLYRSNYVLYKEIAEKVNETNYSYDDLYLDIEEEYVQQTGIGMPDMTEEDIDRLPGEMRECLLDIFEAWEEDVMYKVAQQLDYCVIDTETGQSVKNTGRNIEALAQTGTDSERQELPYVYYVMITFDSIGNPDKVAVKGNNPDELLKSVQAEMKSRRLESGYRFTNANSYSGQWADYYGYGENGRAKRVSCSLKAPQNTIFIYALTQEQKNAIVQNGMLYSDWDEWYAYYQAGVGDIYWVMLVLLTVVALLVMMDKRYVLYHIKAARIPLEASVCLAAVIFAAFQQSVIGLVNDTNRGYFDGLWREYLFFLPSEYYPVLTNAANFGFLFLLFGGWFYTVNTFGEVPALGIKGFLKERSICIRVADRFIRWCKRIWHGFKEELLHVDLGEETGHTIHKVVLVNFFILAVMCSMWLFGWFTLIIYSVVLYFLLKKYIKKLQDQYKRLLNATGSIAEGNLNTAFDEDFGVFESYKEELYKIQEGFRKAVDEEVKSQRMKAELITNVSHDLKTPLTAITTYIDLLKEEGITQEQRKEYIGVLEKKSLRLKTLIEDLFEVSKANSRNVTVNLVEVDICNLMRQVYLEYEDKVEDANLIFRFRMPEEKVVLKLDSEKTYRIFENLYSNIIKYAMTGSRVYVDLEKQEGKAVISLRNMSAVELHVAPNELTERFVRGDSSRNTEGSGLGLAIAKSFTEIQGGKMEIVVDGDLFKVMLVWDCEG